ncbi:hypothetical protein FOCC_FOCC016875 [Frankliniella occidentalis]|nr:hypothetical protein FOCC_FOCC016875 [Frankliniella occidentalis]
MDALLTAPAPARPPRRPRRTRPETPASSNDTVGGPEDGAPPPARAGPRGGILRGASLSAPLADESLGLLLLRALQRHGERAALVDAVTAEGMTYKDLVHESVTLARALRTLMKDIRAKTESTRASDAGIAGDDSVVGVFVENRKELLPSLLANLLLGVPVTMLNPLSNTGELVRAWTSTRPSLALCSWGTLAAVLEASVSLPSLTQVVVFPSGNPEADAREAAAANAARRGKSSALRVAAYAELLKRTSKESLDSAEDLANAVGDVLRPLRSDTHTAYLLQCGRGGRIARLTHRNLQYTVQLLQENICLKGLRISNRVKKSGRILSTASIWNESDPELTNALVPRPYREPDAAGYGWTADDVLLLGAPLSHAFGLGICLGALALGLKVVIMPYFREQLFLSAVQAHKVSQLVLVPRQAALLAHSPLLEDAAVLAPRGLRGVVCAAAPLPRALHRDLTRRLAAPCRQAYGLTQASCSLLVAPRGAPPDTQGRVVPGAEAKAGLDERVVLQVVDAGTGAPLGPLQVGELYLRAPSIMAGYVDYARAQATQDDDDDQVVGGWLRTGDLAYYDRNECVFVVDRLKDVTMYTRGHFKEFDGEHE